MIAAVLWRAAVQYSVPARNRRTSDADFEAEFALDDLRGCRRYGLTYVLESETALVYFCLLRCRFDFCTV